MITVVIHCSGFVGNKACRSCYVTSYVTLAKVRERAATEGWTVDDRMDYCPSCTRRRRVIEANLDRDR